MSRDESSPTKPFHQTHSPSGPVADCPDMEIPRQNANPNDAPLECPSPETIVHFSLRLVPAGVRNRVINHLRICPHCRDEVEALSAALATPLDDGAPDTARREDASLNP
jgi:hypothetical protein